MVWVKAFGILGSGVFLWAYQMSDLFTHLIS
jgi:hypothetical protein